MVQDEDKCWRCEKDLDPNRPDKLDHTYCAECEPIMKEIHANMNRPETAPSKIKKKLRTASMWAVIAGSAVFLALYYDAVRSAFKPQRPFRTGTYATDLMTDECLNRLWKISKDLNENQPVDPDILCPANGVSYRIEKSRDDVTVHCPDPGTHGFREIKVSRKTQVPEIE